jgi:hypothetical protein
MTSSITYEFTVDECIAWARHGARPGTACQKAASAAGKTTAVIFAFFYFLPVLLLPAVLLLLPTGKSQAAALPQIYNAILVHVSILILTLMMFSMVFKKYARRNTATYQQFLADSGAMGKMPIQATADITSEGMLIATDVTEFFISWEGMVLAERIETHLFVGSTLAYAYVIPLRAFETPAQAEEFCAEVLRKAKVNKPQLSMFRS